MEEETQREQESLNTRRDKYSLGNANKGGAAFNIISLDYQQSKEGEFLKQRDEASRVRNLLRSKNVDTLGNAGFNLLNGENRRQVEIPLHEVYNPVAPTSKGSQLSQAGA